MKTPGEMTDRTKNNKLKIHCIGLKGNNTNYSYYISYVIL